MRAALQGLALAATLVLTGCIATHDRAASADPVVSLGPDSPGLAEALAHYSQALIDEVTPGGADRSLDHWRGAVAADPTNTALRLKLSGSLLGRKETAEAIRILEAGRTCDPRSADIRLLLGGAYQVAGQLRPAGREFRQVIRLAPDHPEGYVRLAALELGQGHRDRALAVLDEGMAHGGAALAVLQFCENMGRLYLAGKQVRDAMACFERIQTRLPENLPVREVLARCYALIGDRPRAIAGLEEVLRRDPRNGSVAFYLGELREEAGDLDRAQSHFERAVELEPTDAGPYLRLAALQLRGDPAKALGTLQRAVAKLPEDPVILAYLGLVYSRERQFDKAVEAFGRAETLTAKAPDKRIQPHFYFWYGSACEQAGRFEQAETLLEACIAADPEADDALNYLAYMWADRGLNLDKAQSYVERALKIAPDDGAYLDTLGWVYFKKGAADAALKALRRALERTPDDPTVIDHVGDALQALGHTSEARQHWLKSLRLKPDQAVLRAKLKGHGVDVEAELRKEK